MYLKSIDNEILYEGRFSSVRQGLEMAVQDGCDLTGINLRKANLHGLSIKNAVMPRACLWGANIKDAAMISCDIQNSDFRAAQLARANLSHSNLSDCDFSGSFFSGVILKNTNLESCCFTCPSILSSPLLDVKSLKDARYCHLGEDYCDLSLAPIIIQGVAEPCIILKDRVIIGDHVFVQSLHEQARQQISALLSA